MAAGTARWSGDDSGLGLAGGRVGDAPRSRGANLPRTAWPAVKAPARSVENKVMDAFGTVTAEASGFAPASGSAPLGRNY